MDTAFIKKTRRTARWEWLILHKAILKYSHGSLTMGFIDHRSYLFYLTRPLLLGEVPPPLLNTLATPKSFTLGNDQMHLSLLSLNQDFPLRVQGT